MIPTHECAESAHSAKPKLRGLHARDTVEFILQNPDGKWNGSGLGDIWDNQIMFKQNIRFPMKGKYSFSVEQAMRNPALPMIMEIGMRIEKFEKE